MSSLTLIVFDGAIASSEKVAELLQAEIEVENWFAVFPNSILLVTQVPVAKVSKSIQSLYPGMKVICVKFQPEEASGFLPTIVGREIARRRF
jgi:hypothetical protein